MIEYQTLSQMRAQVGRMIQDTSVSRGTKIDEWINTYYADAARDYQWPQLIRPSEELQAFTAGNPFLYLPKDVETVLFILPATYARTAGMSDINQLIQGAGGIYRTSGQVVAWAHAGESGIMRDFYSTAAEQVKLLHDGATSITAVVHGTIGGTVGDPSSSEFQEEVTVLPTTGGTTVQSYRDIASVSCAVLPAGVSLTASGITSLYTYAKIVSGETTARYKRIRLLSPSSTGEGYTVYYKKRVAHLAFDNQSVEIPVSPYIVRKVVAMMYMNQREVSAAAAHNGEAELALQRAIAASTAGGEGIQQAAPMGDWRHTFIVRRSTS